MLNERYQAEIWRGSKWYCYSLILHVLHGLICSMIDPQMVVLVGGGNLRGWSQSGESESLGGVTLKVISSPWCLPLVFPTAMKWRISSTKQHHHLHVPLKCMGSCDQGWKKMSEIEFFPLSRLLDVLTIHTYGKLIINAGNWIFGTIKTWPSVS